jgi:hypothetical protein
MGNPRTATVIAGGCLLRYAVVRHVCKSNAPASPTFVFTTAESVDRLSEYA